MLLYAGRDGRSLGAIGSALVGMLCSCGSAAADTEGASAESVEACISVCVTQSRDCPSDSPPSVDECQIGCRGVGENADDIGCGQEWHDYVTCVERHLDDPCNELFYCAESKVSWTECKSGFD